MRHTACTVVLPIRRERQRDAADLLQAIQDSPTANPIIDLGEVEGLHYASGVLLDDADEGVRLVLEWNGDGVPDTLVDAVARHAPGLPRLLACCPDWKDGAATDPDAIKRFLHAHLQEASAYHVGNVGRQLEQVKSEARLRETVIASVAEMRAAGTLPNDGNAVAEALRSRLKATDLRALLEPAPPRRTTLERLDFAIRLLGPVAAIVLVGVVIVVLLVGWTGLGVTAAVSVVGALGAFAWKKSWRIAAVVAAVVLAWPAVLVLLPFVGAFAIWLHVQEAKPVEPFTSDEVAVRRVEAQEDQPVNLANHLTTLSRVKPGLGRRFTLRTVLVVLDALARVLYDKGRLGTIDSIHFAHWSLIDGGRNLIFLSNFDGSWESYLDDFIEKEAKGLTSIWSNTVGFPKTTRLLWDGATDGPHFKDWARWTQRAHGFWFHAYPALTVRAIDQASELRNALATPGAALPAWLAPHVDAAKTGAGPKPAGAGLPSRGGKGPDPARIQALVLSGHAHLPATIYLGIQLPPDPAAARSWLAGVIPSVTSAADARPPEALHVALAASGLAALGVPDDALATFGRPFHEGMVTDHRSRILGDLGQSDPATWAWGTAKTTVFDGLIAVFGPDGDTARARATALAQSVEAGGGRVTELPYCELPDSRQEHFGFADGISQPMLTGTPNGDGADQWSRLAAGEIVLGLPDESEGPEPRPPCLPEVDKTGDELGRDGSFLVIRQIAQDVAAFRAWARAAAGDNPTEAEQLAAKLVGRHTDGTSLVRDAPGGPTMAPQDNAFGYRAVDPAGLGCPLGAHVRRANPRDGSSILTADEALRSVRRHRMIRRGRRYGPELPPGAPDDGVERGLVFVCLVADIGRQFEFVQHHWLNGRNFASLGEVDPLTGSQVLGSSIFTEPTLPVACTHDAVTEFTTTRGGGYFFLPSLAALRRLAAGPPWRA